MKIFRALLERLPFILKPSLLILLSLILCAGTQNPPDTSDSSTNSQINQDNQIFLPLIGLNVGNVYYVSIYGNDKYPGTSTLPWRTISKAARTVEAGDIVYIRGGIYQEAVNFKNLGTHDAPIKILAYPGETPVIDGNNFTLPETNGNALLKLSGNYLYASGIEVRYSSYLGVLVDGTHNVANKINSHHNLHSGMRIAGDYGVIEYSHVWSNDMQNYNGQYPRGDSTALTASRNPLNAIIRGNVVNGNWGIGLSTYEATGTIIEDNVSYDNYGPNIYISDVTHVTFQRNFVFATGNMTGGSQIGIQVADETLFPPSSSSDIKIINNIVYHTKRNLACWNGTSGKLVNVLIANNTFVNSTNESGIVFKDELVFDNVVFTNNIIQQDGDLPLILVSKNHPGLYFSNNLWSETPQEYVLSPGDIISDPFFTMIGDPYSPEWFMLSGFSLAIGEAAVLPEVAIDYFGTERDALPDIGAHEYSSTPED
jgi:hypothetical protein